MAGNDQFNDSDNPFRDPATAGARLRLQLTRHDCSIGLFACLHQYDEATPIATGRAVALVYLPVPL